jgi:hypothetical protein
MTYRVVGHDQQVYGPVSAEQLHQWQAEGRVNFSTYILPEGATEWRPLSALPEFGTPPTMQMPPAPIVKQTNDLAVAGLVCGVLSNVCVCVGALSAILGIVFSIIALTRADAFPERRGRGMAVAGLVLSALGLTWHWLLPWVLIGLLPLHSFAFRRFWHFP